jgi:hypothetical protein
LVLNPIKINSFWYLNLTILMLNTNIRRSAISLILTGWLIAFASQATHAQYFQLDLYKKREFIAFKFVNNLIIIPLKINGQGPYNFIVDTGVGIVLLTDPGLMKSVGTGATRSVTINGIGDGNEMTARIQPSAILQLGTSASGQMPIAILTEDPFNLSSYVGMPIHGLIGYELFSSFRVRINYASHIMTIEKADRPFSAKRGTRIPISIEERKPFFNTEVRLEGGKAKQVKLIIDTGAGHPLSLETDNSRPIKPPQPNIEANLGIGLSGTIHGHISRLPTIRLGKYSFNNILCAYPGYNQVAAKSSVPRNGNLGNAVLKRFTVVFDYGRGFMYLTKNFMFREPFEHDMSGMELSAGGKNYQNIFVSRIETDSPAEEAGIKTGDQIISVNFKRAQLFSIEEINNLLKSQPNRTIVLEIQSQSASKTQIKVVQLRRRI